MRAAVAAVASGLQIVKRVRIGMRGRYIGQLPRRRGRARTKRPAPSEVCGPRVTALIND
ncbi:hypothetical protein GCM10022384_29090 [Streptomyces marokkonensis]|uniref:Transposase n=1 Tax=Streptomyces marokkonensis TaxID=324855 RepID=A0ABP7Q9P2_9ACTN